LKDGSESQRRILAAQDNCACERDRPDANAEAARETLAQRRVDESIEWEVFIEDVGGILVEHGFIE
jgi:hypothetical protein